MPTPRPLGGMPRLAYRAIPAARRCRSCRVRSNHRRCRPRCLRGAPSGKLKPFDGERQPEQPPGSGGTASGARVLESKASAELRGLDVFQCFYDTGSMETKTAVAALAALAQETRLSIFRLLVQVGPEGVAAGQIGEKLEVPPATLSFHLKELSHAGLVSSRQQGASSTTLPTLSAWRR